MQDEFEMSMMGKLNFFLGLQITQSDDGILINQAKYTKELLKKFKMDDCKPIGTPMSTSTKLDKDKKGTEKSTIVHRNGLAYSSKIIYKNSTSRIAKKKIDKSKSIDFAYFTDLGLKFEDWFATQGWLKLFEEPIETYPRFIKQFYVNYQLKNVADANVLVACLDQEEFTFTAEDFNEALGLTSGGIKWYEKAKFSTKKEILNFSYVAALKVMCVVPSFTLPLKTPFVARQLLLEFRILHKLFTKSLIPWGGHYDIITKHDTVLMWDLATGVKLDLGYFIMHNMAQSLAKKTKLNYGSMITKLCMAKDIDLEEEEMIDPTEPFGVDLMKKLKYSRDDKGIWQRSTHGDPSRQNLVEDDEGDSDYENDDSESNEENDTTIEHSSSNRQANIGVMMNSMLEIKQQMVDISNVVNARFVAMNERFDSVFLKLDTLTAMVTKIEAFVSLATPETAPIDPSASTVVDLPSIV